MIVIMMTMDHPPQSNPPNECAVPRLRVAAPKSSLRLSYQAGLSPPQSLSLMYSLIFRRS